MHGMRPEPTFVEIVEQAFKLLEQARIDDEERDWLMMYTSCPHYIANALFWAARYRI